MFLFLEFQHVVSAHDNNFLSSSNWVDWLCSLKKKKKITFTLLKIGYFITSSLVTYTKKLIEVDRIATKAQLLNPTTKIAHLKD